MPRRKQRQQRVGKDKRWRREASGYLTRRINGRTCTVFSSADGAAFGWACGGQSASGFTEEFQAVTDADYLIFGQVDRRPRPVRDLPLTRKWS